MNLITHPKRRLSPWRFAIAACLISAPAASAQRGDTRGLSATAALEKVAAKHSPALTGRIVEMQGRRGQSQPREWRVVVHDERSPTKLRTVMVGELRAIDEGENNDFYPAELPIGFASTKKLKIDSTVAFEVLLREAKRAKIGFDSVDYKLRSIEFGDEPVWSLAAKDARGRIVARVILSGYDATVFRTVWYHKTPGGFPRIVDSAIEGLKEPLDTPSAEPAPSKREVDPELPDLEPIDLEPVIDPGTEEAEIELVEPDPAPEPRR